MSSRALKKYKPKAIFNLAAETHVDNSIEEPVKCIKNNIMSTLHLLEYSRNLKNLRTNLTFNAYGKSATT